MKVILKNAKQMITIDKWVEVLIKEDPKAICKLLSLISDRLSQIDSEFGDILIKHFRQTATYDEPFPEEVEIIDENN